MPAYAEKGENLAEMVHENLGELTPAIFRDLRKPHCPRLQRGAIGVFLAAACFGAHLYQNAAASPFLRERCRANWGRWRKNVVLLARELF